VVTMSSSSTRVVPSLMAVLLGLGCWDSYATPGTPWPNTRVR
jgi:hypothetical protein